MAEKDEKRLVTARLVYPEVTEEDSTVYANYLLVNHTPWDFALHFGSVTTPLAPKSSGGEIEMPVKKVVTVKLPVTLIRGVIDALKTNLELYEKQHGEVKIPKKDAK
jgi:uncharacterized protein DUF3467